MEDERQVRQQGTNPGKSKAPVEPDHPLTAHIEHVDGEPPLIEEITKITAWQPYLEISSLL